ncbi:lipoprotein [Halobacillus ihumii]|uniref:lipoprotein n=1 Tax=Halobacillus ihumii TaxID=2686092 RepID=UPI0013D545D8|nr:lipoprotein [Halobacillus ihumii]
MKKVFSLLILLLVLAGCSTNETSNYHYIFVGESEHWKAKYDVEGTEVWKDEEGNRISYSHEDSYEFLLEYKGTLTKLASFNKLEYSFRTSSGGGSSKLNLDYSLQDLQFTRRGSSINGAKLSKDEVIKVIVKWGNNKEKIELQSKK